MPTDLTTHIANFKKWLANDTETAPGWQKGLAERLAWYGMHLSKEAIGKLVNEITRDDIAELVRIHVRESTIIDFKQVIFHKSHPDPVLRFIRPF